MNTRSALYIEVDIIPEITSKNKALYSNSERAFCNLDISSSLLSKVDLIISRDCLVHFSLNDAWNTLINFKRSGSKYLLITTFIRDYINKEIVTGYWCVLNFEKELINFPKPIYTLREK
jgi:hypothetical protein